MSPKALNNHLTFMVKFQAYLPPSDKFDMDRLKVSQQTLLKAKTTRLECMLARILLQAPPKKRRSMLLKVKNDFEADTRKNSSTLVFEKLWALVDWAISCVT